MNRPFHHLGLVQYVLGHITDEFAMRLASHSVPAVLAAQPIEPLPNEQLKDEPPGTMRHVHYSPIRQNPLDYQQPTFDQGYNLFRSPAVQREEGVEDAQFEEDIGPHLQRMARDDWGA